MKIQEVFGIEHLKQKGVTGDKNLEIILVVIKAQTFGYQPIRVSNEQPYRP